MEKCVLNGIFTFETILGWLVKYRPDEVTSDITNVQSKYNFK